MLLIKRASPVNAYLKYYKIISTYDFLWYIYP
jgi:hypothetical protein